MKRLWEKSNWVPIVLVSIVIPVVTGIARDSIWLGIAVWVGSAAATFVFSFVWNAWLVAFNPPFIMSLRDNHMNFVIRLDYRLVMAFQCVCFAGTIYLATYSYQLANLDNVMDAVGWLALSAMVLQPWSILASEPVA